MGNLNEFPTGRISGSITKWNEVNGFRCWTAWNSSEYQKFLIEHAVHGHDSYITYLYNNLKPTS